MMTQSNNANKLLNELTRALRVQQQVSQVGFDWPSWHGALNKVKEELAEVSNELGSEPQIPRRINEELGDLMFAVINVIRHQGVCPEQILAQATDKFERRYRDTQQYVQVHGLSMEEASVELMEAGWQYAKQQEK